VHAGTPDIDGSFKSFGRVFGKVCVTELARPCVEPLTHTERLASTMTRKAASQPLPSTVVVCMMRDVLGSNLITKASISFLSAFSGPVNPCEVEWQASHVTGSVKGDVVAIVVGGSAEVDRGDGKCGESHTVAGSGWSQGLR